MIDHEDGFNRHSRRAHNVRMSRLVAIRAKLGKLGFMSTFSSLTTAFSVAFSPNRKKMVAASYKAWHKNQITKRQLEFVKESV